MERERRHLAAASAHLHLAAAEHYMAEAGAPRRPSDIEMGLGGGHGGKFGVLGHGHGEHGGHGHGGHGGHGHAGGHGGHGHGGHRGHDDHVADDGLGHDDDDIADEELECSTQHLYELLLLASFVPPAPAYKALPRDVVEGGAWTWIVIVYGVFLAIVVTTFSVRVLGTSSRCIPTVLRVLLTTTVVTEVLAAIYMMPAGTLTVVGASFTVLLLLAAHLFACRRRR